MFKNEGDHCNSHYVWLNELTLWITGQGILNFRFFCILQRNCHRSETWDLLLHQELMHLLV